MRFGFFHVVVLLAGGALAASIAGLIRAYRLNQLHWTDLGTVFLLAVVVLLAGSLGLGFYGSVVWCFLVGTIAMYLYAAKVFLMGSRILDHRTVSQASFAVGVVVAVFVSLLMPAISE